MNIHDRVYRYTERRFQGSGKTEFPRVREVARALRMTQATVMDAIDGDPECRLMSTGHNIVDERDRDYPGSLTVETL